MRGILKEREKNEFDRALTSVDESLEMVQAPMAEAEDRELADFYKQRLQTMQSFFNNLDNLVAMLLALDELRLSGVEKILGKYRSKS